MRVSLTQEFLIISKLSWSGFTKRWRRSLSALFGTIGVVAVFVSIISIAQGYQDVVKVTEGSDNVMVLMSGATSEIVSTLSAEQANLIKQSPLVAHASNGLPMVSAEAFTTFKLANFGNDLKSVSVRGVEPVAFALRSIKIVSGRTFTPGRREVIVGRRVLQQMRGMKLTDQIKFGSTQWTVVGVFEADSGLNESEMWVDVGSLQEVKQQGNSYSVLYLRLAPGEDVNAFEKKIAGDPRINASVLTEKKYLSSQSDSLSNFVEIIGYATTFLMALGAIFAALNTSHATVTLRTAEFATLKALGFRDLAILLSVIAESLLLAIVGAAVTVLACYWIFDGYTVATILGSHSYSAVVFSFDVSARLMLQAVWIAAAIGVIGALYPSVMVLHLPISRALSRRH